MGNSAIIPSRPTSLWIENDNTLFQSNRQLQDGERRLFHAGTFGFYSLIELTFIRQNESAMDVFNTLNKLTDDQLKQYYNTSQNELLWLEHMSKLFRDPKGALQILDGYQQARQEPAVALSHQLAVPELTGPQQLSRGYCHFWLENYKQAWEAVQDLKPAKYDYETESWDVFYAKYAVGHKYDSKSISHGDFAFAFPIICGHRYAQSLVEQKSYKEAYQLCEMLMERKSKSKIPILTNVEQVAIDCLLGMNDWKKAFPLFQQQSQNEQWWLIDDKLKEQWKQYHTLRIADVKGQVNKAVECKEWSRAMDLMNEMKVEDDREWFINTKLQCLEHSESVDEAIRFCLKYDQVLILIRLLRQTFAYEEVVHHSTKLLEQKRQDMTNDELFTIYHDRSLAYKELGMENHSLADNKCCIRLRPTEQQLPQQLPLASAPPPPYAPS